MSITSIDTVHGRWDMNREEILALYDWATGICFRHPADGVQSTIYLTTIRPAAGGIQEVRACADCVVDLERESEAAALAASAPYSPGRLAAEADG